MYVMKKKLYSVFVLKAAFLAAASVACPNSLESLLDVFK